MKFQSGTFIRTLTMGAGTMGEPVFWTGTDEPVRPHLVGETDYRCIGYVDEGVIGFEHPDTGEQVSLLLLATEEPHSSSHRLVYGTGGGDAE